MSRSHKKPWIKDPTNSYMKKLSARQFRRVTKQIMRVETKRWSRYWLNLFWIYDAYNEGQDRHISLEPILPHRRELINQYDVCDYIFYSKDPTAKKKVNAGRIASTCSQCEVEQR